MNQRPRWASLPPAPRTAAMTPTANAGRSRLWDQLNCQLASVQNLEVGPQLVDEQVDKVGRHHGGEPHGRGQEPWPARDDVGEIKVPGVSV